MSSLLLHHGHEWIGGSSTTESTTTGRRIHHRVPESTATTTATGSVSSARRPRPRRHSRAVGVPTRRRRSRCHFVGVSIATGESGAIVARSSCRLHHCPPPPAPPRFLRPRRSTVIAGADAAVDRITVFINGLSLAAGITLSAFGSSAAIAALPPPFPRPFRPQLA